jgi:hypothetical protein
VTKGVWRTLHSPPLHSLSGLEDGGQRDPYSESRLVLPGLCQGFGGDYCSTRQFQSVPGQSVGPSPAAHVKPASEKG